MGQQLPPLTLLLLLFLLLGTHPSSTSASLSLTKGGNIHIGQCDPGTQLFRSSDPRQWACEDATTYTWRLDFLGELQGEGFSAEDRERLAGSAGYCPHRRCQLGNASSAGPSERCPPGLCYTKLENGRPSFGACCFTEGFFESQELLGYYNRSQVTPKPIYKTNRVVLGGNINDTSLKSFINANEIAPGLIAAQCPMTAYPNGFANTVEDMKVMLVEQNVRIWIQLSPASVSGELMSGTPDGSTKSFCEVFPLKYLTPDSDSHHSKHRKGISNFSYTQNKEAGYFNMTYKLTAFVHSTENGNGNIEMETYFDPITVLDKLNRESNEHELCAFKKLLNNYCSIGSTVYEECENIKSSLYDKCGNESCSDEETGSSSSSSSSSSSNRYAGWEVKNLDIEHVWFYKWDDFEVPAPTFIGTVNNLADRTVDYIRSGHRSTITCFSGRGRTGTFSAIVLAKMKRFEVTFFSSSSVMSPVNNIDSKDIALEPAIDLSGMNKSALSKSDVVDIVVDMRRSRDGLVETPTQLKFVMDVLQLQ